MKDPLQIFFDHEYRVIEVYDETEGSPAKALKILADELPDFADISYNSFKAIFRTFVLTTKRHDDKKRILGWNLTSSKNDGYIRAGKRIAGRVRTVHLGKDPLDIEAAKAKLAEKERYFRKLSNS